MEMTYEELKAEAKRQGFSLIPLRRTIKLLPCICGHNRRERWYGKDFITLKCQNCGRSAHGTTETKARIAWNKMIEEAKK